MSIIRFPVWQVQRLREQNPRSAICFAGTEHLFNQLKSAHNFPVSNE
jgi:hypothetical protein